MQDNGKTTAFASRDKLHSSLSNSLSLSLSR